MFVSIAQRTEPFEHAETGTVPQRLGFSGTHSEACASCRRSSRVVWPTRRVPWILA